MHRVFIIVVMSFIIGIRRVPFFQRLVVQCFIRTRVLSSLEGRVPSRFGRWLSAAAVVEERKTDACEKR